MSFKQTFTALIIMIIVLVASSSFYIVSETKRGLVLRFGKVHRTVDGNPVVYDPGLHFKIPMAERVISIDSRIQTLDGEPDRIVTSEKKDVIVDTYVKWRVSDVAQFYLRANGDIRRAERLLERLVDNGLRAQIGQRTVLETVSGEREQLMEALRDATNQSAPEYGIHIVDIRIKKINYPSEVYPSVFERMRAERTRVAKEFRSEGEKDATIIRAKIDADVKRIVAEADRKAREIKGSADAEAAQIYASVYNRSPEFYAFLRSLDAYKKSFTDKNDILLLDPDSDFFKYLKRFEKKN